MALNNILLSQMLAALEKNAPPSKKRSVRRKKRLKPDDDLMNENPVLKRLNGEFLDIPKPLDVRIRAELSPS